MALPDLLRRMVSIGRLITLRITKAMARRLLLHTSGLMPINEAAKPL
jgi:hypothetical protein